MNAQQSESASGSSGSAIARSVNSRRADELSGFKTGREVFLPRDRPEWKTLFPNRFQWNLNGVQKFCVRRALVLLTQTYHGSRIAGKLFFVETLSNTSELHQGRVCIV